MGSTFSDFLDRIYDAEAGRIDPVRFSAEMRVDEQELADMAHVHRTTVQQTPGSKKLQNAMRDILRVVAAAESLCGDMDKVVRWFRYQPLADFRYLTPMQLVCAGKIETVLDYVACLQSGATG